MGNEQVEFNARFGGQTHHVRVPLFSVLGIYARETGQGMIFSDEDAPQPTPPGTTPETGNVSEGTAAKPSRKRPQLKVVK
jgi:stringent starvation protein B